MEFFAPELELCKLSDPAFAVQCPSHFRQFKRVVVNKEAVYRIAGQPFKDHVITDKWLDDLV